ncbi:MAG: hypothetical protein WC900_04660 [Oscillospiraceae bacterium]|jgi:hypothetical protein
MIKKCLCSILTFALILCSVSGASVTAQNSIELSGSAADIEDTIDILPCFNEKYVPLSLVNYSLDDKQADLRKADEDKYDIVDIIVSKKNLIIEANTFSEYVDVFGELKNGKYVKITNDVDYSFSDTSVAVWIYGRILAEKKGNTTLSLEYNGIEESIYVTVKNYIDIEKIGREVNQYCEQQQGTRITVTRQSAASTAQSMVNMTWTPAQNLYTWFGTNRDPFYAGVEYTGMPYTQYNTQTTKAEFLYALENANDFYTRVQYGSYLVPKYGNDCSGFLSICWNLSGGSGRNRWNTADFINAVSNGTFDEITYYQMGQSDGLYKTYPQTNHVIMVNYVYQNSSIPGGGYVSTYEQTDIKARTTSYTFQQLSDAGYVAFTRL